MNRTLLLCLCGLIFLSGHLMAQALILPEIGVVKQQLKASSDAEAFHWSYTFASLQDFLAVIERPSLTILTKGETADVFYVVARHEHDLYIIAAPRRGGEIARPGFRIDHTEGGNFVQVPTYGAMNDQVTLVQTGVTGPPIPLGGPYHSTATNNCLHDLQAERFPIRPDFHGSADILLTFSNDQFDDSTASVHVVWN